MKKILNETDRIKEIMGISLIIEQPEEELTKILLPAIKKAFGKAGKQLTQATTDIESNLGLYLRDGTEVDATVLNTLKNEPNYIENLKAEVNNLTGYKKLKYLNRIKKLENSIPSKTVSNLSQDAKTIFKDIQLSSTFSQNEINKINLYVDKLTSNIPFYKKITAMNTLEIKNILEPLGQDVNKAITELNIEIETAKKANNIKLTQKLGRALDMLKFISTKILEIISEITIGIAKGLSGVVEALSKKVLSIIAMIVVVLGIVGYSIYKIFVENTWLKGLIPSKPQSGSTPQSGQPQSGGQNKPRGRYDNIGR